MSVADKLLTITENQSRVYDAGKIAVLQASKYMNASTIGAVVAVNDVSSIEHDVGVTVRSKNLFYFGEDNVYKMNPPTASGTSPTPRWGMSMVLPAGTYTLRATGPAKSSYIYGGVADLNTGLKLQDWKAVYGVTQANTTLTFANDVLFYQYCSQGNADGTTKEFAVEYVNEYSIQLERGDTATEYVPYSMDFSQVRVKRYGKNLCPKATNSKTIQGITFTVNNDGTVTANGTATGDAIYIIPMTDCPTFPIGTVANLSGCPTGGSKDTYYLSNGWIGSYDYGSGAAVFVSSNTTATNLKVQIELNVKSGVTVNNIVFKPQITIGSAKAEYTPYIEPTTHMATADGTVEGVKSLSNMLLVTDTNGVTIDCSYLRDIDTYIDNLTMSVAMTGGD